MTTSIFTQITLIAFTASAFLATAIAQNSTAHNVRSVKHATGIFFQDSPTTWREDGAGQFHFNEVDRTDRAVYLYDTSRRVYIILDLFQRKILFSYDTAQSVALYNIESDSPQINGRLAKLVHHMDAAGNVVGGFSQQQGKIWLEFGATRNVNFTLTETGRDDWSVYLQDSSRGVTIRLDLSARKVMYSDRSSSSSRPLYDIAAVE